MISLAISFVFPWPFIDIPYVNREFFDDKLIIYCSGISIKKNWFDDITIYIKDLSLNRRFNQNGPHTEEDTRHNTIARLKNIKASISCTKLKFFKKDKIDISNIFHFIRKIKSHELIFINRLQITNLEYKRLKEKNGNSIFISSMKIDKKLILANGFFNKKIINTSILDEKMKEIIKIDLNFDLSKLSTFFNIESKDFALKGIVNKINSTLFFQNIYARINDIIFIIQSKNPQSGMTSGENPQNTTFFRVENFNLNKLKSDICDIFYINKELVSNILQNMQFPFETLQFKSLNGYFNLQNDFKISNLQFSYEMLEIFFKVNNLNIFVQGNGKFYDHTLKHQISRAYFCAQKLNCGEIHLSDFNLEEFNFDKTCLNLYTNLSQKTAINIAKKFLTKYNFSINILNRIHGQEKLRLNLKMDLNNQSLAIQGFCSKIEFNILDAMFPLNDIEFLLRLKDYNKPLNQEIYLLCNSNKVKFLKIFSKNDDIAQMNVQLNMEDLAKLRLNFVQYFDKNSIIRGVLSFKNREWIGRIDFNDSKFFIPYANIKKKLFDEFYIDISSTNAFKILTVHASWIDKIDDIFIELFPHSNTEISQQNHREIRKNHQIPKDYLKIRNTSPYQIISGTISFNDNFDSYEAFLKTYIFDNNLERSRVPVDIHFISKNNKYLNLKIPFADYNFVLRMLSFGECSNFNINFFDYKNTEKDKPTFISLNCKKILSPRGEIKDLYIKMMYDGRFKKITNLYGNFDGTVISQESTKYPWWKKIFKLKTNHKITKDKSFNGYIFMDNDDTINIYSTKAGAILQFMTEFDSFFSGILLMKIYKNAKNKVSIEAEIYDAKLNLLNNNLLINFISHIVSGFSIQHFFRSYVKTNCKVKLNLKEDNVYEIENFAINFLDICITGEGLINTNTRKFLKWKGDIIPFYGVSFMIGQVPLLNIISHKGKGIISMAYRISGSIDNPSKKVQPSSIFLFHFMKQKFKKVKNQYRIKSQTSI
ncbi:hypothetical protein [Candidatus Gromoviella agglomerans]|uniref:hypothetical protein n=1 Tax=Candidatus Gromoviella agglomerans TaxID=2806609 RepID=UPI001E4F9256|nr:hypothetical protein [Candidatus Gromoviella agglomerans]UFX98605.1 DUF3971 domain-containing protein [Candidatus Gromoviella agglomerans]